MTECGLGSANPLGRPELVRPGSAGPLVPGGECKFVDVTSGQEVGPGEQGKLGYRGPNVMRGYLNRPEETAATIVDGWLRTGDIGHADPDGWLHIVDRAKELIKYKASRWHPPRSRRPSSRTRRSSTRPWWGAPTRRRARYPRRSS